MDEPTKEVMGYFKNVRKTRKQFQDAWTEQMSEMSSLCETQEECNKVMEMQCFVAVLAGRKWDKIK